MSEKQPYTPSHAAAAPPPSYPQGQHIVVQQPIVTTSLLRLTSSPQHLSKQHPF